MRLVADMGVPAAVHLRHVRDGRLSHFYAIPLLFQLHLAELGDGGAHARAAKCHPVVREEISNRARDAHERVSCNLEMVCFGVYGVWVCLK